MVSCISYGLRCHDGSNHLTVAHAINWLISFLFNESVRWQESLHWSETLNGMALPALKRCVHHLNTKGQGWQCRRGRGGVGSGGSGLSCPSFDVTLVEPLHADFCKRLSLGTFSTLCKMVLCLLMVKVKVIICSCAQVSCGGREGAWSELLQMNHFL